MRNLLILAVAASFAVACGASRTDDEVGAAPDQGDTTTVTATDTVTTEADTTMGQVEADTSFVEQDTTPTDPGMSPDTTAAEPGFETDTTMAEPGMGEDSVGVEGAVETDTSTGAWTDTTAAEVPADTTVQY